MKRSLMYGTSALPALFATDSTAENSVFGKSMPTDYGEFDGGYKMHFVADEHLGGIVSITSNKYPITGYDS